MTVQEIFNTTAVRSVEEQILYLYHETERNVIRLAAMVPTEDRFYDV